MLASQHHRGDFRSIGQQAEARLQHFHPGRRQSLFQFGAKFLTNQFRGATQTDSAVFLAIVRVAAGQVAQRRFTLNMDIIFVVIDIVKCLGGVHHAPDHHGCDLDGVAIEIVHFGGLAMLAPQGGGHIAGGVFGGGGISLRACLKSPHP